MSDEHKAALAAGRSMGRSVKVYLEALDANRPKRGRKRTPDSIKKRLDTIDAQLVAADPVKRLLLVQERIDLLHEIEAMTGAVDLTAVESDFVAVARDYSMSKGISYAAWREIGVSAVVLKRAGISRSA
jgi:uncharacterized protein YicC (UPF0701 family)